VLVKRADTPRPAPARDSCLDFGEASPLPGAPYDGNRAPASGFCESGPGIIRPFDEIEFKLDTGEAVTAVCGGYISPTRARFVFKDALGDARMNEDATNAGGYYKSKGRRHVLEEIYPHLPPELREIIEPRPLVETIDGERVEYADPLWIPSGTDVFGPLEGWYAEEPDSVQLEIFKTERGRVKERGGETVTWWLRSPIRSFSGSFVRVNTDGTVYATTRTVRSRSRRALTCKIRN